MEPAGQRSQVIAQLREALRRCEGDHRPTGEPRSSTGCGELDRLLPEGGLGRGVLVEWLASSEGSGAMWLALAAAREACRAQGPLVIIDSQGSFYPPAASLAGIEPERLIVVRVTQARDEAWALDQSLRSSGVGAVLCVTHRLAPRAARRLQLAAETSGGLGLLVRPASVRDEPCWAAARLLVEPLPGDAGRRLSVEVLRTRGSVAKEIASNKRLELEIDDETGDVRLAAPMESATSKRRRTRA
jgi:protein ImuA